MKIAIHNSFIDQPVAESELGKRICLAARNLGWEAIEVDSFQAINKFSPDFVLATHFKTPKLSKFPTYGCMWSPPIFLDQYQVLLAQRRVYSTTESKDVMEYANVLSYDGYLSSSHKMDDWLNRNLSHTAKQFFIAPFFTSCNQTEYIAPNLDEPHLVYLGSNWDGRRFRQLFRALDDQEFMEVYGSNWNYLKKAYKGTLPFDGVSVLDTLRQAGVGLCLHRPEHTEAETPSMRIFEIVASGALAICGEHKFIRASFGNDVLYIDTDASISKQIQQISNHISWIKNNQNEALEMSKRAHNIFLESYTLEKLLLGIIPHHHNLIKEKGFIGTYNLPEKQVQFIVRVGDRNLTMIKRCLDSIVNQTYKNVAVILVVYKIIDGLSDFLQGYNEVITIKIVNSECTGFRSTQLKDGINNITSDYFGILDDDDLIYPNHAHILISLLEKYKFVGVAYSGVIKACENSDISKCVDKDLAYFEDFNLRKIVGFQNFVTSNSFIANTSLISNIFREDPRLEVAEDFYLILHLCQKSLFVFSYEVTCEFYWRINLQDNITVKNETLLDLNPEKVLLDRVYEQLSKTFWNEDFVCVVNSKNDDYLHHDLNIKSIKFHELKYSKYVKALGAGRKINAPSLNSILILRNLYLKLSKGGRYNKNPNILAKVLVFVKNLFFGLK